MRKNGFTLIELMIGMVIAVLSMGMMMMMFKQVSQVSFSSSADAQYDTDIQIGLMVAQKFLQNAGYGSGQANDIVRGSYAGNDAIFWRYAPDIDQPALYKCQGISEKVDQEDGRSVHRLLLLTKADCTGAGIAWSTGTGASSWNPEQTIIAIKKTDADKIYSYELSTGPCTPYGIDEDDENTIDRQQITIKAKRQHVAAGDAGGSIQHTLCLNNTAVI